MSEKQEEYETMSQSENDIDIEVESLRQILMALNQLDEETKRRTFNYLKSKYRESWPSENY